MRIFQTRPKIDLPDDLQTNEHDVKPKVEETTPLHSERSSVFSEDEEPTSPMRTDLHSMSTPDTEAGIKVAPQVSFIHRKQFTLDY